ncbi:MAG TPA: DNA-processing protein DprA, partial [Alphaproteobacteria bacterium]|nr:DNA-processing protein DprA [Alphaproteobacteria bacterium]
MNRTIRPLSAAERLDWLRLIRTENIGPVTFRQLLGRFGDAAAALDALPDLVRRGGRRNVRICPPAEAERELAALDRLGVRLIGFAEPDYPDWLGQIDDAPPLLTLRGRADLLAGRSIGIVGARNASINGRRFAERLARDLGAAGIIVTSGFAPGIDAATHEGALPTGTIAVLAGGIDVVYPSEHQALYDRIAEAGALVAECPLGTQPQARHFPRRNRIISGLSQGVLVVEAARRSGSLITARFAAEQGREVFAVPGFPLDPRAQGCNDLIRNGATLVQSADDVLEELSALERRAIRPTAGNLSPSTRPDPAPSGDMDAVRDAILQSLSPTPTP